MPYAGTEGTEDSQLEPAFISEPGLLVANSTGTYAHDVEFEPIEEASPTDVSVYITAPNTDIKWTLLVFLSVLYSIGAYVVLTVRFVFRYLRIVILITCNFRFSSE